MSIATTVTRGYGTFGTIADVVRRGYTAAVVVTYPEGTLTTRGYGNPTTIADIVRRNYGAAAASAAIGGHHPLPPFQQLTRRRAYSNALLEEERRRLRALEAAKALAERAEAQKVAAQRSALKEIRADLAEVEFTRQEVTASIVTVQAELDRVAKAKKRKAATIQVSEAFSRVAENLRVEIEIVEERLDDMVRHNRNQDAIVALLLMQ